MNILFIFAHPDDEAYGPAGTIAKSSKDHNVTVISLCNGARPGNEHVEKSRTDAFIKSCGLLGASWKMYGSPDCSLNSRDTLQTIENLIKICNPNIVYTHNISDVHQDHRIVSEACLVACRPKPGSTINSLYMCETASSTDWAFGQIEPVFVPNVYVDIENYIGTKMQCLEMYSTEIYEFPDPRSIKSIETMANNRGKQIGVAHAEAFKLVFKLD